MKVLVVAPHMDDEVLGCGGIMAKYAKEGHEVYVAVVTNGQPPLFTKEEDDVDKANCLEAHKLLGVKETFFLDLPAAMLDTMPKYKLNGAINKVVQKLVPDEIYIPHKGDMHFDHKMINEACMVAVRPRSEEAVKRVYAYETLSETEWDVPSADNYFMPNVFVDISEYIDLKIEAMAKYSQQIIEYPSPRSKEGIRSLALNRGMTVYKKYAESFMLIREIR